MREILFRGKSVGDGVWVEGFYIHIEQGEGTYDEEHHFIQTEYKGRLGKCHEVNPDTVGQFTGMTDKNGKKIFEGDIIECWSEGVNAKGEVLQRNDGLWIIYPAWQKNIIWGLYPDNHGRTTVKVIGNVHDQ